MVYLSVSQHKSNYRTKVLKVKKTTLWLRDSAKFLLNCIFTVASVFLINIKSLLLLKIKWTKLKIFLLVYFLVTMIFCTPMRNLVIHLLLVTFNLILKPLLIVEAFISFHWIKFYHTYFNISALFYLINYIIFFSNYIFHFHLNKFVYFFLILIKLYFQILIFFFNIISQVFYIFFLKNIWVSFFSIIYFINNTIFLWIIFLFLIFFNELSKIFFFLKKKLFKNKL